MKLYIMGPPGSGKSTLAKSLAGRWDLPLHSLELLAYDPVDNAVRTGDAIDNDVAQILREDSWIVEGGRYRGKWRQAILEDAAAIILLDPPLAISGYRLFRRRFDAARINGRWLRGWRQPIELFLRVIWERSRRAVRVRGIRSAYAGKVIYCRSNADVAEAIRVLDAMREARVTAIAGE